MAGNNESKKDAIEEPKAQSQATEETFALQDLMKDSHSLFGVGPHVIDGALYGQKRKDLYTKSEIKEAIDKFHALEVK